MMFGNRLLYFNEKYLTNEPDIFYNKDKFESGKINLCFITGLIGSGKSTMAQYMEKKNIEKYELDDVFFNKIKFSMDNLKEYGDLIYSFFKTTGKKFYYTKEDVENGNIKPYNGDYDKDLINEFIKYSINYSKSHKDRKFIIEGIWLYKYIDPQLLKDYAVYIKGTSVLISALRAGKRSENKDKINDFLQRKKNSAKETIRVVKANIISEKDVQRYRNYFTKTVRKS